MSKPTATELAGAGLPDEVMLTGASAAPQVAGVDPAVLTALAIRGDSGSM